MQKNVDLLTIGDVCIDLYLKLEGPNVSESGSEESPKICFYHGSKIPVRSLKSNVAGNAVNVSIGAATLGLRSSIYSEVGNDPQGDRVIQELSRRGVDTNLINKNDNIQTGIHPVIVYAGERTIFSHHEQKEYKVTEWPQTKWIYYTSIGPGFEKFHQQFVPYLKQNPQIGVAFNPGSYHIKQGLKSFMDIMSLTHVLFVNREEAEIFVGKADLEEQHLRLQECGPKLTIITEGKKGASGHDGNTMIKVNSQLVEKPIDKTGAGDAFASGVISALTYNKSLHESLLWGTLNSAAVVKEVGAINGLKTREQMEYEVKKIKI